MRCWALHYTCAKNSLPLLAVMAGLGGGGASSLRKKNKNTREPKNKDEAGCKSELQALLEPCVTSPDSTMLGQ